ncbi:RteC domain-containing protein [Mariniphaga sediminis]|uniref:RteC domain-containing protein n=1 Tax=Mariniphaga sediminis TaxID=1628158 RepID=UPI003567C3B6
MNTNTLEYIVEQLKNNLHKIDSDENNEILKAEQAVGICSTMLLELREYVDHLDFKSKEEEIRFFKEIKSYVLGEYLYYSKLWEILIRQPVTSIRRRKKYLRQMIAETQKFFNENTEFYLYYRSGATHFDEKYFVRTEISCTLNCSRFIYDPFFSTSHDYTLAAIKSNEKIAVYCNDELNKLKRWGKFRLVRSDMTWSLTKRDLMLIVYGLYYTDAINKGNDVSIKDLVKGFESLFNVGLSGYYHIFYEAIQRQQPFEYLDQMKETLSRLKEESDENKRQKRRSRK